MPKFVLFAATLLLTSAAMASEIPLENGDFEQPMVGKRVPGWSRTQHAGVRAYEVVVDAEDFAYGKHSIRMRRTTEQVWGMLRQIVEVKGMEGKSVELTASLKSEDVGKKGWVAVMLFKNFSNMISEVRSKAFTGDTDWTEVTLKAVVPNGTNAIDVAFELSDGGTGWVDNVHLRVIDAAESKAVGAAPTKPASKKAKAGTHD